MPSTETSVTIQVKGGPSATVPWTQGMTALNALELAFAVINPAEQFTYALQYYGPQLGYLVIMINETYDSFISKGGVNAQPFFYWEFLVNSVPGSQGVSQTRLNAGDTVGFEFEMFASPGSGAKPLTAAKYAHQTGRSTG
jgi:Domain of unknown function (DUF4430)